MKTDRACTRLPGSTLARIPEEVASALIAEILAVERGHSGRPWPRADRSRRKPLAHQPDQLPCEADGLRVSMVVFRKMKPPKPARRMASTPLPPRRALRA